MHHTFGLICGITIISIVSQMRISEGASSFLPSNDGIKFNQWYNVMKEYLATNGNRYHPQQISNKRNEIGNMALYQLYELDKLYGQKARPRFGKRSEIYSENSNGYERPSNLVYTAFENSGESQRR